MPSPVVPQDFHDLISDPTASLCGQFINTLLKGWVTLYKFFAWLLDSDGNITQEAIGQILPPGMISLSGVSSPPTGWLACNGQLVNRTTYANLFAAIGETFGAGDSTTTFAVPDMRDRVPMGVSGTVTLAATGGAATYDFDLTTLDHKHACGQFKTAGGDNKYFIISGSLTVAATSTVRQESGEGSTNAVATFSDVSPAPESDVFATDKQVWNTSPDPLVLTLPTQSPYLALTFIIKT